jgi:hypothetical protein
MSGLHFTGRAQRNYAALSAALIVVLTIKKQE